MTVNPIATNCEPSHRSLVRSIAVCSALLFGGVSLPSVLAAQSLYKWIDEDGQVRYSDRLTVEQKKQRHHTLSPEGYVLETKEAAIPPEELKRRREEQKRRETEERRLAEEAARQKAIQDHHDNVLLMTFSTEAEIIDAQQERMDVLESVIRLLRKNIKNEEVKLEKLEQSAMTTYTDLGKEIPGGMAQNIEYFQEKILGIQQQLALKLEERDRLKRQNAADLLRYRELIRMQQAEEAARQERHRQTRYH